MNKNLFIIVIILMSVALFGTVWIQILWIKNAIMVKQEQFDQNVFSAMENSIARLQKNKALENISRGIDDYDLSANKFVIGSDTFVSAVGLISDMDEMDPKLMQEKLKLNFNNDSSSMKSALSEMLGDSTVSRMSENSLIIASNDSGFKGLEEKLAQNIDILGNIFQQMVIEIKAGDNPEDRLDLTKLEETLKNELLNKGVDIDFDYIVLKGNEIDSLLKIKSKYHNLLNSKYTLRLFPNDVFEKNDALFVNFSGTTAFIYRSLMLMLIGSLSFTLIILLTFATTIYIILKQKKLSQIKSDFINNMTHEFKTPIATISLAADSVANPKTLKDKDNILYFINIIKQENKRMNAQVEKVLQMALLEKHDLPFVAEKLSGNELVMQAVDNILIQVKEKSGDILTTLNAENDNILVDREHFLNVVFNLLDNANKYSYSKPFIEVSSSSDTRYYYLKVKDMGIGMTKDVQKKAFEKFYRQTSGNIHNVKGFGLGLSYVKEITEKFGGSVTLISEIDKGSTFTISIPLENGRK